MFWDEKEIRKEKLRKRNRRRKRHGLEPTQGKAGRWVLNIILFLLACVFVYAAYRFFTAFLVYRHNGEVRKAMQQVVYETIGTEEWDAEALIHAEPETRARVIDSLRKVNPQIIGWIHVDDTTIDYPVVQGTDNEYYLNHNVYDEETICGSIFLDADNTLGAPMENYILYGHRMRDDSMFGHLSRFLDETFFLEHPAFSLVLEDGTYTCEIFAVYQTATYEFAYDRTHPGMSAEEYLRYVQECKAQSRYVTEVEVTEKDRIITLSTCDYEKDSKEGRLVVQAKLVKADA